MIKECSRIHEQNISIFLLQKRQLPSILEKLANITDYQTLIEKKERETIVNQKAYVDDEKCGDHYALIPTNQVPDLETLSKEEGWLYDEVVRSVIATFYEPMTYNQTELFTEVNHEVLNRQGSKSPILDGKSCLEKKKMKRKRTKRTGASTCRTRSNCRDNRNQVT